MPEEVIELSDRIAESISPETDSTSPTTTTTPADEPIGTDADTDAMMADFFGDEDEDEEQEVIPEFLVPLRRVKADDMPLKIGGIEDPETGEVVAEGQTYFLQKGKSVWFLPASGFAAMFSTAGLLMSSKKQSARAMVESMERLCERISELTARWDLIGMDGQPLPQPYKRKEVIMNLTEDQLAWLIEKLTNRESPEQRKND